ncbi:hypothetical protein [Streptomyces sp. NPDC093261]|uniref:hypothetical protein n=1 Tax=Streptomyces sp. NPDC093261 TaxID=3366037 RepID=UPI00380CDC38
MDAKEITDIATGGGTLLLAAATFGLGWYTKKAVVEAAEARRVWKDIALDSARARLDASAPAVSVYIDNFSWPPKAPNISGHFGNDWPAAHHWTSPREDDQRIALTLQVWLKNNSSNLIRVTWQGPFLLPKAIPISEEGYTQNVLPKADFPLTFEAAFTLKQWAENWEAAQKDEPLPWGVEGWVTVDDISENGVDDVWAIDLTGAPLERLPDDAGKWQIAAKMDGTPKEGAVTWTTPVRHRTYWLSRSRREKLG